MKTQEASEISNSRIKKTAKAIIRLAGSTAVDLDSSQATDGIDKKSWQDFLRAHRGALRLASINRMLCRVVCRVACDSCSSGTLLAWGPMPPDSSECGSFGVLVTSEVRTDEKTRRCQLRSPVQVCRTSFG